MYQARHAPRQSRPRIRINHKTILLCKAKSCSSLHFLFGHLQEAKLATTNPGPSGTGSRDPSVFNNIENAGVLQISRSSVLLLNDWKRTNSYTISISCISGLKDQDLPLSCLQCTIVFFYSHSFRGIAGRFGFLPFLPFVRPPGTVCGDSVPTGSFLLPFFRRFGFDRPERPVMSRNPIAKNARYIFVWFSANSSSGISKSMNWLHPTLTGTRQPTVSRPDPITGFQKK